jgi:hypothetical protein
MEGSTVATTSPRGSDVDPELAGAGIEVGVSVSVGVAVGVLVSVVVGVNVTVAVSVGSGVSVAGGTAVSVGGITSCTGVAVGSSPRQPVTPRRNKNRLKISLRFMCHLTNVFRCQVSAISPLLTSGPIENQAFLRHCDPHRIGFGDGRTAGRNLHRVFASLIQITFHLFIASAS